MKAVDKKTTKLKSDRLTRWVMITTLVLGLFVVAFSIILTLLAFYPYKTIEVFNAPVPVLNNIPVRQGETVFYEVKFCKYTNAFATVSRQLQGNGISLTQAANRSDAPATSVGDDANRPCSKDNPVTRISGSFIVPQNTPAGNYHLKVIAEYQVNVFRTIPYVFETQNFKIENAPKIPDNRTPFKPEIQKDNKPLLNEVPAPAPSQVLLEPGAPTTIQDTHGLVDANRLLEVPKTKICVPILGCIFK